MSLILTNATTTTLDINDLGIGLAASGQLDITLESDPLAISTSGLMGDLLTLIVADQITIYDPLDGTTVLSTADALGALESHNDPHFRMPPGGRIADALDVDFTSIAAGDMLSYNSTTLQLEPVTSSSIATLISHSVLADYGTDPHIEYTLASGIRSFTGPIENEVETVAADSTATITTKGYVDSIAGGVATAAGSVLGLQQQLLAEDGQPGKTILAVGFTNTGKVQGVSLGDGNVVEVYSNGTDFTSGDVLYREFMSLGEPICFTGLTNGAIITSTQGFYGVSENIDGAAESPMPLLSLGLSFTSSFMYAFRDSNEYQFAGGDRGFVFIVNGPLDSSVSFTYGSGGAVESQPNLELSAWEWGYFECSGNVEYIINSTNRVMACAIAALSDLDATTGTNTISDTRLIMPLTNDGITWPRSGNVSAPYNSTVVDWWTRDNTEGSLNSGLGVSPGAPIDFDSAAPIGTGASDADYEPDGATRVKAVGLITAYSGADGNGNNATPLMPVSAMSQVVAQPYHIADASDGSNSGIAIASPYEGTAKVYQWDYATSVLSLAYTLALTRNGVTIVTKEDQNHPAAGGVANETSYSELLVGNLQPGVVISDVPITVVVQNSLPTLVPTIRSQNGTTTTSLVNDDDETLMLGWTPPTLKAEITEGTDGVLYKRVITAGAETWVVA